jgi:hypothetical protein
MNGDRSDVSLPDSFMERVAVPVSVVDIEQLEIIAVRGRCEDHLRDLQSPNGITPFWSGLVVSLVNNKEVQILAKKFEEGIRATGQAVELLDRGDQHHAVIEISAGQAWCSLREKDHAFGQ